MLFSRIIKKRLRKQGQSDDLSTILIALFFIILIAAGILQLIGHEREAHPVPLLTQTEGLVQLANIEDISNYTDTSVTVPTQTFDSALHVIGVYTQENAYLPKGTVALVYTRDNWRYTEINYRPIPIEQQLLIAGGVYDEEVTLTEEINGTFFERFALEQCIDPPSETMPGKCTISYQLYFPVDGLSVVISADGDHATKGEMIETARSILSP